VRLTVQSKSRDLTARNHSATHLLQAALRKVLGDHVEQAGSSVNADRLRFDFTHFSGMSTDESRRVEAIVNEEIEAALPVRTDVMSLEDARKTGAMALFGEKYGDKVRVVRMGDFSIELCGGTHVANTSAIGPFKIISEGSVASGVRRIEAITGPAVLRYYTQMEELLETAAAKAKVAADKLPQRVEELQSQIKELQSEIDHMKSEAAKASLGDIQAQDVNGIRLVTQKLKDVDMNRLRDLGDEIKTKIGEGVVVLVSDMGGKVNLMVTATDEAVKKGAHAGNLIKQLAPMIGGGGGGKPTMAQAGGKDPSGIDALLKKVSELL